MSGKKTFANVAFNTDGTDYLDYSSRNGRSPSAHSVDGYINRYYSSSSSSRPQDFDFSRRDYHTTGLRISRDSDIEYDRLMVRNGSRGYSDEGPLRVARPAPERYDPPNFRPSLPPPEDPLGHLHRRRSPPAAHWLYGGYAHSPHTYDEGGWVQPYRYWDDYSMTSSPPPSRSPRRVKNERNVEERMEAPEEDEFERYDDDDESDRRSDERIQGSKSRNQGPSEDVRQIQAYDQQEDDSPPRPVRGLSIDGGPQKPKVNPRRSSGSGPDRPYETEAASPSDHPDKHSPSSEQVTRQKSKNPFRALMTT